MRLLLFFLLLLPAGLSAQLSYRFSVNLTDVSNDKLEVELQVPQLNQEQLLYQLPAIVPGTYKVYDFGRFVSDFVAYDSNDNPLQVKQLGANGWEINNAKNLKAIRYKVEDTFDTELKNVVFEPAGTNIEAQQNFVINPWGFFGYFKGYTELPYEISVTKPASFYGSSSLTLLESKQQQDVFSAPGYVQLADAPIMYNRPDTTWLSVGGAEVLISVYSPNEVLSSSYVASNIADVLEAQRKYLGGTLPVDKYAFIIYLTTTPPLSGAMGALEHSYSSFYYLPEGSPSYLTQVIKDVAAHEFFHILTPLNIHSEEIHNFDFNAPEMSDHLWLYEGVTEYFAGHVQVKEGLLSKEDYLDVVQEKIANAKQFNQQLPFTLMSRDVLGKYEDQYINVYEKGALIGLALDLELLRLSNGTYSLRQLMADLAQAYGPDKPFKDEELFDEITRIAGYPALRQFFAQYVEGAEPLPLEQLFQVFGLGYSTSDFKETLVLGFETTGLELTDDGRIVVDFTSPEARIFKLKKGDIVTHLQRRAVNAENYQRVYNEVYREVEAGDQITITVLRGRRKMTKDLKGAAKLVREDLSTKLVRLPELTDKQQLLYNAWLGPVVVQE